MNRKLNIFLTLICLFIAVTGIFMWNKLQAEPHLRDNVEIYVNKETSKTLKAELADFYPGCTQAYTITLTGDTPENRVVTLNFKKSYLNGSLDNYLTVVISTADVRIEKSLKELLDGDKIELGKNANTITLTYGMPENTGNEAQGATADFYIILSAK